MDQRLALMIVAFALAAFAVRLWWGANQKARIGLAYAMGGATA